MKIVYTIENEKIKLHNFELSKEQPGFAKVYDNCLPNISLLHIKGSIRNKTHSFFDATPGHGIILSIQIITQNSRFEFESFNNLSANFAPEVQSIQLLTTNIPFRHSYENPGLINRIDFYIPAQEVDKLIEKKLLTQLYKRQMLDLTLHANNFSPSINDFLNALAKELEKPQNKSLCTVFEDFLKAIAL